MAIASGLDRPVLGLAALLFLTLPGLSQDWPQWRGPDRDGVVHGVKVPARWPKALTEEWNVEVGEGISSPVVVDGKVYVARMHISAWELAGKKGVQQFYGFAEIDAAGKVVRFIK